jgi:hypothetical protein
MTDNNYQTSIAKLQALHGSVIKSEDDRGFFSHLYRYLEFVCDNSTLETNAWRLFGETYLHDHEADKDNPDFQKLSNMDLKFEGLEKLFTKVLSDYRGSSRVYYSWLFLYIFYYLKSVSPDTIATFGKNMPDAEAPHNKLFSAKLRYELKSASFPLDMSGNTFVKRSDFSLYFEVFHQDFIGLLSESANELGKIPSEPLTEVELTFDDIYPVVTEKLTDKEHRFGRMVQSATPYKVIKHLYESPGIAKSANTLPADIKLSEKGLIESLRGSDFYPNGGVLSVFLTVQKRPAKLMLHHTRNLGAEQLKKLAAEADEIITNS